MTARGWTPRNDHRPKRWPCSADSSRNDGPAPRSFRYAETGVSVSAMKVWRSGTSVYSRASSRTSSSDGPTSIPASSAATAIEDLERIRQRQASRGQQHVEVVEHVGGLLALTLGRPRPRGPGDLLGLLLPLGPREGGIGKQARRVALVGA